MSKTFRMGGVHPNDRKISNDCAIEVFPLPRRAYISMAQHLGAPATPAVNVGDKVKTGQLIGTPSGFMSANVHSSVSGTVAAVEPVADLAGNKVMSVVIDVEGDEWMPEIDRTPDIVREITLDGPAIISRIKDCGVVGLGGASFPTHIKLSPPPGKTADCLIINGAECEPYLTSDYRIMMERPEEIVLGAVIMMKALNVTRGYIGIEDNKPAAIESMRNAASGYPGIEVVVLRKKYPQGGEKQLINAVTGRSVPSMGLPIDTGAVVQNAATALAVYEAVQKNKPLIDNTITVTGQCLPESHNWLVRVGTPYSEILGAPDGIPEDAAKIISGGPMMGKAVANINAPTVKANGALLLLTEAQTRRMKASNCIRCGKCVDACPMGLEPYLLNKLSGAGKMDELEEHNVYDCIECGCCMFTCPAGIPLLDHIRQAKGEVIRIIRSRPKK